MTDPILTLEQLKSYNPCYGEEELAAVVGDLTEAPLSTILQMEDIPPADRVWVACAHLARVDRPALVVFVQWCAEGTTYSAPALAYAATYARTAADAADATLAAVTAADAAAAARTAAGASAHAAADAAYAARSAVHQAQIEYLLDLLETPAHA